MNLRFFLRWLSILWLACTLGAQTLRAADEPSVLATVEPVRVEDLRETLTAYGTVEYSPDQAEVLDVQGEGLVSRVRVAAGQRVRRGEVLLELGATANGATELEHARIAATFARKDFERLKDLRGRQLATNAEVQTAEENLAKAESALANARQRLGDGQRRELRAGIDGFVEAVHVHVGDIAAPGAPLLSLARGDRLRVRLGIEPEDLPRVREGQKVVVTALHPDARPVEGRVLHVYYQVDPKTRLAVAVVPLGAAPDLLPGAVVRGELIVEERPRVLTVPRQAVLFREGKTYLFVAKGDHARMRWVEIGRDDGQRVEIRAGLSAGEAVVVTGNYELQDGMALRTEETP